MPRTYRVFHDFRAAKAIGDLDKKSVAVDKAVADIKKKLKTAHYDVKLVGAIDDAVAIAKQACTPV